MRKPWFRPWGWIYRPTSWQGVLLTALTLAFCASDTLYGVFPFVVPALLVLIWIASKSSEDDKV